MVFFTVGVGILQFSPKNPKTPSRSIRMDDGTEYTIDVLLQEYSTVRYGTSQQQLYEICRLASLCPGMIGEFLWKIKVVWA